MRVKLSLVGSARPSEYIFEDNGGTFGRSLKCQWVLPDDERILSAVHGRVALENNKFMLIDESTNGIFLDGRQQPLGRGNGVAIVSGLRFRAANHLIEAQILPARETSPFVNSPMQNHALPREHLPYSAAPSAEQALRERSNMGDIWGRQSQDPLAYLGPEPAIGGMMPAPSAAALPYGDPAPAPPPQQPDPFAGYGSPPPAAPVPPSYIPHVPAPNPGEPPQYGFAPQPQPTIQSIPAAFDPVRQWPTAAAPAPLQPPMPRLPQQPLPAQMAPAAAAPQKLIPDDFDPLSILAGPARRREQQNPWNPAPVQATPVPVAPVIPPDHPLFPTAQPTQPSPVAAQPASPLPREPLSPSLMADVKRLSEPAAMRVSEPQASSGDFDAVEAMKARREERKARLIEKAAGNNAPSRPAALAPAHAPNATTATLPPLPAPPVAALPNPLAPNTAQPPAAARPASTPIDSEAVVALFTGMGLPGARIATQRQLQVMQEVGEMVRAFSDGLVQVLAARRMVKSEFRMDETRVEPEENNPFKHFKITELALDELFVTRTGGYQAPAEAAASAFDDVKEHVMLTMAAMQRAIKLLFERLSPEAVTRDSEADSAHRIRGLGGRKGKWETYVETHQRMSGNFDGVARQLIAEAFAQVQEEQARRVASQYWENRK